MKKTRTPVLALCRELIAAGHDPSRPLHAYRDGVLALRIRSIGEAARLRVATHGVGFESAQECTTASPMRFPDRAAVYRAMRVFLAVVQIRADHLVDRHLDAASGLDLLRSIGASDH